MVIAFSHTYSFHFVQSTALPLPPSLLILCKNITYGLSGLLGEYHSPLSHSVDLFAGRKRQPEVTITLNPAQQLVLSLLGEIQCGVAEVGSDRAPRKREREREMRREDEVFSVQLPANDGLSAIETIQGQAICKAVEHFHACELSKERVRED